MTADDNAPEHVEQHATASDHAQINQAGHDQYITNVTQPRSPLPQALAALPAGPESLVGRQTKVNELLGALSPAPPSQASAGSAPTVVVSAVAGLAGIGKTALALHTAHAAAERGMFPGGVLYVTLRGYDPAGAVSVERALGILLRQLGIRDEDLPGEIEELAGLYQSELARRAKDAGAVLVLADDASTPAQLTHLVPAQRAHRLLVTSRDTLTSPTLRARILRLDELTPEAAAELIQGAVALVLPGDGRCEAEPGALAKVVAHCGRLPLALQIAAALLVSDPGLPIATLADDLAGALDALQFVDAGGQSLAVRAAFDLSHRRLAPETARVFGLLGLCEGPDVSTDAVAALADRPVRDTRRTLATIASAGLLTEQPVGSGRWRMHDLIRLYTTELTTENTQDALDRLLRHYTELVDAADDHLRWLPGDPAPAHFDTRGQALAWLDAEHPTLVATIGRRPHATVALALRLQQFLILRRHFDDALTTTEHALTTTRELGDRRGEGRALNNLGNALRQVRRFEDAIDAHTQAADIYRELGDRHGEGTALNNLGLALQEVRRFEDAIDTHTRDLTICRELGDRRSEGTALNNLGLALRQVRRFEDAIDAHTQTADIYRDLGDRHGEGQALNNLGLALRQVRRFEDAIDAHTQTADIYRDLGDKHREGTALNNLGNALREVRRFEEAIDAHTRDLAICRDLGDRHGEGQALNNLGLALQEVRRFEDAIDAHTQAADIYRELSDRHGEGQALNNLGLALREVRRFEEAIDAHTRDLAICRELGDRHGEGRALNNLGLALQAVRRFQDAIDTHTQAATIFRELRDRHREAQVQRNLGDVVEEASRAGGWWGRVWGRGRRS
ncbi:tetratricopeptide repeat protein [Kitasatospora sp. NPDC057223]|uniref:tetratricopeptide repeat protein n=1 Tax=Kitasatospora sp. NPDC057223 TaxID=3346055 RepID=UPI0036399DFE